MGIVYRAFDSTLQRPVAVKIIVDSALSDSNRSILLNEAQSAAKLNHPNIVTIYDVVESTDEQGNRLDFIVMEYVQGKTLHEQPPENEVEKFTIIQQVCLALEHAHKRGVIHRDLKPENIMLVGKQVKLMDFGQARSQQAGNDQPEEYLAGSPAYISPEQVQGRPPDARSDLYSLGVVMYELFTGVLPFGGKSLIDMLSAHLYEEPQPPAKLQPGISLEVQNIILKLLEKTPEQRFQSAAELLAAWDEVEKAATNLPLRHNLPAELTSFIGRQAELSQIKDLLAGVYRLVSLTGSGGVGKTRLALRAAWEQLQNFPDGVWLVELASLSDAELLPQAVISALGLRVDIGISPQAALVAFLRQRRLLLVLDNCEHLIHAAIQLVEDLLRQCPSMKIIVSSREALGVAGEAVFQVPSLAVPAPDPKRDLPGMSAIELLQFDAVRLFTERAVEALPEFELTDQNKSAVVNICQRLDGIPLALELAAARVRVLDVFQIAGRLDDRFRLLTGGRRGALPRQQTLRALIDWSYDLLDAAEKAALQRLSVFSGGWVLGAAEAVCIDQSPPAGQAGADFVDLLTQLVNKSLVMQRRGPAGEPRYYLLETIRQYARDKLLDAGFMVETRACHFNYYYHFTLSAQDNLRGALQFEWLQRVNDELDNLRAALDWALTNDPEAGVKMAFHLRRYWSNQVPSTDGREWLGRLLDTPAMRKPSLTRVFGLVEYAFLSSYHAELVLAKTLADEALQIAHQLNDTLGIALALHAVGYVLCSQGYTELGGAHFLESLSFYMRLGNKVGMADVLFSLGTLADANHFSQATEDLEKALALARERNDLSLVIACLDSLGMAAFRAEEYETARQRLTEALSLLHQHNLPEQMADVTLHYLGELELYTGNYDQAQEYMERVMILLKNQGQGLWIYWATVKLGYVYLRKGDLSKAAASFAECLANFLSLGVKIGVVFTVEGIASLAVLEHEYQRAMTLYTWANMTRQELGDRRPPDEQRAVGSDIDKIRARLDTFAQAQAHTHGTRLSFEQAIDYALQVLKQFQSPV